MVDRPLRRLGRVLPLPLLVAGLAVAIDLDLPASRLHAADGPTASPSPEQVDFFESKVRPVLADACLKCHGATKQSSDLRLDSRSAMLSGGASGPVLVPGNPDASLLVQAVRYTHEDVKMPPKPRGKLSDSQVEALATWVKMGAPWPDARPITATASDPDPAARHWAFQPVKAVAPPSVAHADRVRTPIDAFILARLESTGIAPSPEADRRTLLRRWSFDLTGLPPTAAEVAAFEADSRPDAHERAVDRLLASPRYGERWARHWLDVARYSDTKGYVFQEERRYPYAYTYRDYVIRSFNDDKPYDTFLIEQIAADRLGPGHDPRALAALGYLTLGRRFLNVREDIVDDRIDVVSRGMLGLTVGCARCHDHKFDPIPMDDYYSLFGVFASTTEPADPPEIPASVPAALARDFHEKVASKQAALDAFAQKKEAAIRADLAQHIEGYLRTALEIGFDARSARLDERARANHVPSGRVRGVAFRWKAHVDATRGKADPVMAAWHAFAAIPPAEFSAKAPEVAKALTTTDANRPVNPVVAQSFAQTPPTTMGDVAARYGRLLAEAQAKSKGSPLPDPGWEALRQVIQANNGPLAVNSETLSRWLDRAERGEYNRLTSAVAAIKASHPGSPPRAMVLTDSPTPFQPRVLLRGNPGRPGKTVPRQFLKVASGPRERQPFKDGSGRLELARAIASPDNPLTARVFVNRVWLQHFGAGLVTTPSDFGLRSDPPSHPELLDWLADDFVRHGWSIKHLHRQILLSGTYRQQSLDRAEALARDPENRLLWKFNRRRLEFEPLRDAVLAVAGALDSTIGGRPVVLSAAPYSGRRTIYGFIDRQNLDGVYRTFDFASPDTSSPRRFVTTVPQQALYLMNSPFLIDQARRLASRADTQASTVEERIDRLYEVVLARHPEPSERAAGARFIGRRESAGDAGSRLSPWEAYAQILLLTNEFAFVD